MSLEFDKETTQEQNQQNQVTYGDRLELEDPEKPEAPEFDKANDDTEAPKEEKEPETKKEEAATDGDAQLDLFGGEQKKGEKKKPASKKVAPDTTVNREFTVYYAGHKIDVPQDDMTLEKVRAFLESDFPELSKERTEMTINRDKQQVVPVVKGAKKG